jgi:phytoene/squalene synthetase
MPVVGDVLLVLIDIFSLTVNTQEKNRLITYLGGPPHETLDTLYTGYLETRCSDDIRDVMGIVQEILQELKEIEDSMSGGRATDRRYTNAQDDTKQAADVLLALEDLFSCVMVQDMDLRQQYAQKKFLFQSL